MSKAAKIISIILGSFLLLVIGVYVAGAVIFGQKIMPNTTLQVEDAAPADISWAEPDTISGLIDSRVEETLSVELDNDPERIINLRSDINYHNNAAELAENIMNAQLSDRWNWPVSVFRDKNIVCNPEYIYDSEMLDGLIMNWTFTGEEKSEDAYIDLNEKEEIVIFPEKYGTEIDKAALKETIAAHLAERDMAVSSSELSYLEPEIKSDDTELNGQLKAYNDAISRVIIIDVYGLEEELKVRDLMDIPAYFYNGEYILDEERIDAYMDYIMYTYDTFEKPRPFTTHDGKKIMVGGTLGDGEDETYGFIVNYDRTRNNIIYTIYDPEATRTEVAWYRVGNKFTKENSDIGDTYIEISLAEQHLWYFKDGKLMLDSPVVTGLDTPSRRTPAGVYATSYKGRNVTLTGEMDGEKWESFVNYWMAITPSAIGIHDAPWRGTDPSGYGGNIYQYNGSHGCINVPLDNEIYLYNDCPEGTCVVIY